MPTIEELEHKVSRLETLFEEVLKERLTYISQRLDQLYTKAEKDKTELLTKTEKDKTELLTKAEKDKTELIEKMHRDKRELIYWMVGLVLGFSVLNITAIWAILSFALK